MRSANALPKGWLQSPAASPFTNVFAAAAMSALGLIGIATPATAQPNDPFDRRIEQLLRQLATKDTSTAQAALVTRGANVQVQGTIRVNGPIKLPLTCTVFISDNNDHSEAKTAQVTFAAGVGTCNVVIPFKWTNTDPDGTVEVFVTVSDETFGFFGTVSAAAASPPTRTSEFDLPEIPLPAQATTTHLTFDVRI